MKNYYLLFATGKDRSGIVSAVSEILFKKGANLEDSSMMRLGGEFGIFLIFTSTRKNFMEIVQPDFSKIRANFGLTLAMKKISKLEAEFIAPERDLYLVKVMGEDRPGIVFKICRFLFKHKFNILDLETHRTAWGKKPGYILFIEGEFQRSQNFKSTQRALSRFQAALGVKINIDPIPVGAI